MKLITKNNCPECGNSHSWNPHFFKNESDWQNKMKVCLCKTCITKFTSVIKRGISDSYKGIESPTYWSKLKDRVGKALPEAN